MGKLQTAAALVWEQAEEEVDLVLHWITLKKQLNIVEGLLK